MSVNRVVLQGSVEECARVVDDSRIEIVLRHESEICPFFFLVHAPFGLDELAERLLTLTPRHEIVVVGWLEDAEGRSPSASITIHALAVKTLKPKDSPFEMSTSSFYDSTAPLYDEFDDDLFTESGPDEDDIPF